MATVFFYIPDQLHLLDLSGVLQAFQESNYLGEDYQFQFIGNQESIDTSSGLSLASIVSFEGLATTQEDIIFIPGFDTHQAIKSEEHQDFFAWLNEANQAGTSICSICTGAFFLAKSGLLSDRSCTTHWRYVKKLAQDFPSLRVQANVLFTKDENIYTSAGIVTGIDLALFLLEERHGAQHAAEVAKELVVYKRRQGTDSQESVYLQYRNHHDERIHKVQDWIVHNLEKAATLESLAELVHLSPRNLTRL
ncbi:MAG TPA: AraC family transcriptional regulator, partial [Cytophagales bacterium]|nr:AraC family transcriptional regulator [Cytophagales bacterium]